MNNSFIRIANLNKKCCKIHSTLNGININSLPCLNFQVRYKRLPAKQIIYNTIPQPKYTASKQERDEFNSILPCIIKDLTDPYHEVPEVHDHLVKFLNFLVADHKHVAGMVVVTAYKQFADPKDLNSTNIYLANILGWCANLWFCSWHVTDDIVDDSEMRSGSLAWHRKEERGLKAIHDSIFAGSSLYLLLKKYFSGRDSYCKTTEWLHEATVRAMYGQILDSICLKNGKLPLEICTMKRFELLATFKAYYLATVPIILAMHFANKTDIKLYNQVQSVLTELGYYFSAQNDIVDCYGDPLITGKNSDDIREGKCTWLIVKALQKATPQQKQILKRYYGRSGVESDLEVKLVYDDLGIFEEFLQYEKESFDKLSKRIREMPDDFPKPYFLKLLKTYYGHELPEEC